MSRLLTDIRVHAIAGFAGALSALAVAWVDVSLPSNRSAPEIVTADLAGIAGEQTLELVSRNIQPEELEAESRAWAQDFQQLLAALAHDNDIIILPAGLGVYGVRDITADLRRFMEARP